MIAQGVELHNVAEAEPCKLTTGAILQRYPREVREALGERGRFISQQASGCELRFVTDAANVRVALTALDDDGDVMVFQGEFFHSHHRLKAGVLSVLHLEKKLDPEAASGLVSGQARFSPLVWRVFLCRYAVSFHGVETFGHPLRPPMPGEVPGKRWLSYGSSITHGGAALNNYNSYVQQAARRLGVDVLNKGLSGACLCEPQVADFLAAQNDWTVMTLEIGVNMRGTVAPDEFRRRAAYLIDTLCVRHPDKPVVLITVYPNVRTYAAEPDLESRNEAAYNAILRELAGGGRHKRLHLIEGSDVLTDFSALSWDLLHPSDYGHTLMGENLSRLLAKVMA
ncbi:Lysophospholipase L1 [Paenibacillus sp. UNCCL117]|uniref:GDSL-type esterase/lipase family protein n=1 Tax=unclassified Paenibacillus TaxID=185978 RepID=UPI000889A8DD|nr:MULTISPECIES: GDSL-type esterase/lipase family protein [unclassified Paenibacillus]SDC13223.1 Lysophospholipase L1 [Paenibacillus sp. cl123]SFW16992.1 Lysophospholipase L1 [Paenibacillus sp. UNCCL117]